MTDLSRPGPLSERLGSLRVGYLGHVAQGWLGWKVQDIGVGSDWEPAEEAERWIDVLVIDSGTSEASSRELRRIAADARAAGVRTVGFLTAGDDRELADITDLTVAPVGGKGLAADAYVAPRVDLDRVSPIGGVRDIDRGPLVALGSGRRGAGRRTTRSFERMLDLELAGHTGSEWLLSLGDLGARPNIAPILDDLRSAWGVVDDTSLHAAPEPRASYLAQLAVAGIPFRLADGDPRMIGAWIGNELADVSSGPIEHLFDPDERERLSVAQRRIALRRFTDWDRWEDLTDLLDVRLPPRPTISAILATNRPEQLAHAAEQVANQNYEPVEPIFVLHGDGFGDDASRIIDERCPNARTVRVEQHEAFGSALNAGADLATGELITKMDDDDWYGADHLWDLVHAMEYSGAELIAKAAEWVYLSELDITMRRFSFGAESYTATMAGGTMMMRRSDFDAVGRFRRARRHIDLGLINDVGRLGGETYRTHGFGYLLNRNASGHTWDIGVDYFLEQSTTQIRGRSEHAPLVHQGSRDSRDGTHAR